MLSLYKNLRDTRVTINTTFKHPFYTLTDAEAAHRGPGVPAGDGRHPAPVPAGGPQLAQVLLGQRHRHHPR